MQKNKAIIVFLVKFFTTYFILFGVYSLYLNQTQQKTEVFVCSPITGKVAQHVLKVSEMLGYEAEIEQHSEELSIKFILNGNYVVRIVEGCSSISIIILFLSFIFAFSGSLWNTIWFGVLGSVLIYVVNILRIIAISLLYQKFPEYQRIIHDLLFPAIIYGLTFILWITWVKVYSNLNKTNK
ncbi:exosortase family protein XrtF [Lutimonas zeaxanthinifaciens]|uniref:exosortase family protein XrtF n=1 Tax=Lutimonas zeaxanthinifaciens TaxID=3060215 RepID=UPI00265CBDD0|nr:exosortase family protein XrtF [Lutimonas sp. YSD2104]WKK66724.1 exosortase family protein XrtF [Lutimonas sp. YSD2104]